METKHLKQPPKTYEELEKNIEDFFNDYKPHIDNVVSPRLFRISIGVSKATLSYWKTSENRRKWFDLIKTYEDLLLAFIEQRTIDLAESSMRVNIVGLLNTLRAYDTQQYAPEHRPIKTNEDRQNPILIKFDNNSKHKLPVLEAKIKED